MFKMQNEELIEAQEQYQSGKFQDALEILEHIQNTEELPFPDICNYQILYNFRKVFTKLIFK